MLVEQELRNIVGRHLMPHPRLLLSPQDRPTLAFATRSPVQSRSLFSSLSPVPFSRAGDSPVIFERRSRKIGRAGTLRVFTRLLMCIVCMASILCVLVDDDVAQHVIDVLTPSDRNGAGRARIGTAQQILRTFAGIRSVLRKVVVPSRPAVDWAWAVCARAPLTSRAILRGAGLGIWYFMSTLVQWLVDRWVLFTRGQHGTRWQAQRVCSGLNMIACDIGPPIVCADGCSGSASHSYASVYAEISGGMPALSWAEASVGLAQGSIFGVVVFAQLWLCDQVLQLSRQLCAREKSAHI